MRLAPIILILASVVLGGWAQSAAATPSVGISDNRPAMFADPLFKQLHTKQVRLIVSYNAVSAAKHGSLEIAGRVDPYIGAANAAGVDVHVAFEHAQGDAFDCEDKPNRPQCKLPTVAQYKAEVTKFLKRYPTVKTITAWNEANHNTQPTYSNPRRAGEYARAAEQACASISRKCTVVTLDLLDVADEPTDPDSKFTRTVRYAKEARKGYGKTPKVCGIHNYGDANRFRTSGTKALAQTMRCKSLWLTETGGLYNFASFWTKPTKAQGHCTTNANCQVAAMKFLFTKVVKSVKNIDRIYIYDFYSGDDGRFDAGIVKGTGDTPTGKKRPAYDIVKKYA